MVDDQTLETVRVGVDRARTRFVSNARIGVIADNIGRYELVPGDADRQVITVTLEDGDTVKANRGSTPPVAGEPVTVNKRNGQYYIEGVATLPTRSDAPRALATVDVHTHNKGFYLFQPVDMGSLLDGGMNVNAGTTTITLKRKQYPDTAGATQVYAGGDTLDLGNYLTGIAGGQQRWAIVYVNRATGAIGVYEPTAVSAPANVTTDLSTAINACLSNVDNAYPYLAMRLNPGNITLTKYKPANGYDLSTKDFIRFEIVPDGIESVESLTDTTITAPTTRDVLYYNGTLWVNQALDAGDIQTGQFPTARLADNSVTNAKVVDGAISRDKITFGAIDDTRLDTNSVTTGKIQTNAVTSDKLANTSVTAGNYGFPFVTFDTDGRATDASDGLIKSTSDPGAVDDSYDVGTLWLNINKNRSWQCVDNTLGAAVWRFVAGQVACVVRQTVDQTLANFAEDPIEFNSESLDTDNMHDNVTNNSRITVPFDGIYVAAGAITYDNNATGVRACVIAVNGGNLQLTGNTSSGFSSVANAAVLSLSAGDYVEFEGSQNSGGSLDVIIANAALTMISGVSS